jgi:hypothetical protein
LGVLWFVRAMAARDMGVEAPRPQALAST